MVALTLLTADGTVLECSESSNAEVFQAARVHLGCLGVILAITLQCVPQFHLQETTFASTLREVLVSRSPLLTRGQQMEDVGIWAMPHSQPPVALLGPRMGEWADLAKPFLGLRNTVARTLPEEASEAQRKC